MAGLADLTGTQAKFGDFGYLALDEWPYDPDKAKALLTEAGFPNGFKSRIQVVPRYYHGVEVGQVIQDQLKQIGINIEVDVPEWTVYLGLIKKRELAPMYMLGWGSTASLDCDAALYAIYHSSSVWCTVDDAALDKYLDEARVEMKPKVRAHLYHLVQMRAFEQQNLLTLYLQPWIWAFRQGITFPVRPDTAIELYDVRITKQ